MKFLVQIIVFFCLLASASANTYYLDPVNGDIANSGTLQDPWAKLQDIIEAGYIEQHSYFPLPFVEDTSEVILKNSGIVQAGDTLVLLGGLHGEVFLRNYINEEKIHIMAKPNHIPVLSKIHLQACKNWSFEGLKVSSEPYGFYENNRLFYIESHGWQGPSSSINITNCEIYSAENPWTEAEDWLSSVSSGLFINADLVTAKQNTIRNIDMGITAMGDFIEVSNNEINNFSGDGIRILGSNIIIKENLIKNCYDVDENHDDAIQSFTTNGHIVDNNLVTGNIIINTDDANRPLNGPLQGIGCFDGIYRNWMVTNNVIHVNHWHGITFLGADNVHIINNTVIDPTPDITPGASWIRIADHKDGTPSENCVVANNVANKFVIDAEDINNVELLDYIDYDNNFVDFTNQNFKLISSSDLINQADIDYSPETDIEGNIRLIDNLADIGAYEYIEPLNVSSISNEKIRLYPNPFTSFLVIDSEQELNISIHSLQGIEVLNCRYTYLESKLAYLIPGMYVIHLRDPNGKTVHSEIVIKDSF